MGPPGLSAAASPRGAASAARFLAARHPGPGRKFLSLRGVGAVCSHFLLPASLAPTCVLQWRPDSSKYVAWSVVVLLSDLTYSAFIVPISIGEREACGAMVVLWSGTLAVCTASEEGAMRAMLCEGVTWPGDGCDRMACPRPPGIYSFTRHAVRPGLRTRTHTHTCTHFLTPTPHTTPPHHQPFSLQACGRPFTRQTGQASATLALVRASKPLRYWDHRCPSGPPASACQLDCLHPWVPSPPSLY